MGSSVVLHVLGCCTFITPEVLGMLLKTSYSIFNMFAEGSLAPAPADGAPIHRERGVVMPSSRQLCTFGRTCHRASRVGNASFRYVDSCLVSKRLRPIVIVHARINAMERHLRARLECTELRLECKWRWICAVSVLCTVLSCYCCG